MHGQGGAGALSRQLGHLQGEILTHLEFKFPALSSHWPCLAACGSSLKVFMVPENTRYLEGIILRVIKSL